MNLFVYGTLKDRGMIQSLLKRPLTDPSPAVMPECTTVTSKWGYLVMIPEVNSQVEGVVWHELTVEDLAVLDRYEGCHVKTLVYQREKRKIIIGDSAEQVWAYFGTATFLTQMR